MTTWVPAFTAVMVAVIGAGGLVWATVIGQRTRETRDVTIDVREKVNGRIDALLATNQSLRDTLLDYMARDVERGDDDA